jgi:nucleotide sugar dehydrogenase
VQNVAIVGYGYVGKAMTNFFWEHYNTYIYDPIYSERSLQRNTKGYTTTFGATRSEVNSCDVAIVCVPTPRDDSGKCDTTIVEETMQWLKCPIVVLKSTVEIGTTQNLIEKYGKNIVFSPEYAGESTYWSPYKFHTDVKETPFFIFGGDPSNTSKCVDLYMNVAGPTKQYIQTDPTSAETAKYMENSFYATKITFCYEMNEICKTAGVDYNTVRELWLLDPRINRMHTSVFSGNKLPFSGKCLPKDTSALVHLAKSKGYDANLLSEVLKSNQRIGKLRHKEKDS